MENQDGTCPKTLRYNVHANIMPNEQFKKEIGSIRKTAEQEFFRTLEKFHQRRIEHLQSKRTKVEQELSHEKNKTNAFQTRKSRTPLAPRDENIHKSTDVLKLALNIQAKIDKFTQVFKPAYVTSIRVGNHLITKSRSVRNLGTWFNDTFDMSQHVTNICSASFFQLHNIRRIRKYLTQEAAATLVHSFVTCRIDYCNSLLYGLHDYQLSKLQRVQNWAARLVDKESKFCHITPLSMKLHWLPIIYRIRFKIALLTFKAISGLAPSYISDLISIKN